MFVSELLPGMTFRLSLTPGAYQYIFIRRETTTHYKNGQRDIYLKLLNLNTLQLKCYWLLCDRSVFVPWIMHASDLKPGMKFKLWEDESVHIYYLFVKCLEKSKTDFRLQLLDLNTLQFQNYWIRFNRIIFIVWIMDFSYSFTFYPSSVLPPWQSTKVNKI